MTDDPNQPDSDLAPEVLSALHAPAVGDPDRREAHIAAALAHFDSLAADRIDQEATVVPFAARRRPGRWISVAAAVFVVIGGVILVARHATGPGSTQSADRAATAQGSPSASSDSSSSSAQQGAAASRATPGGAADSPAYSPASPTAAPAGQAPEALSQQKRAAFGSSDASLVTACHAPRLRAALASIGTTVVDGNTRIEFTYVSGPGGTRTITVLVDPLTCTRS